MRVQTAGMKYFGESLKSFFFQHFEFYNLQYNDNFMYRNDFYNWRKNNIAYFTKTHVFNILCTMLRILLCLKLLSPPVGKFRPVLKWCIFYSDLIKQAGRSDVQDVSTACVKTYTSPTISYWLNNNVNTVTKVAIAAPLQALLVHPAIDPWRYAGADGFYAPSPEINPRSNPPSIWTESG